MSSRDQRLRLLYASERPPFPFFLGGAARSAHYLMSSLTGEFGVDVLAVGSAEFGDSPWSCPPPDEYAALGIRAISGDEGPMTIHCAYPVQVLGHFWEALRPTIDNFSPDVLWTQLDGAERIAAIGAAASVRTVVFVRDAESPAESLRRIAARGARIVCNSRFLAGRIESVTNRKAFFVYPSLDVDYGISGDADGCVTMINTHRVKGIDTFFEIARRMPEQRFLLVESWPLGEEPLAALHEKLAAVPNVRFQNRVADMRQIYGQTRLLLVPSVWEEAFGRVAIEAQSCRIPVIASARGGLPESVGRGGICIDDYLNPAAWVQAIRALLAQPERCRALGELAYRHATSETFTARYAASRFYEIIAPGSREEAAAKSGLGRLRERLARVLLPRR